MRIMHAAAGAGDTAVMANAKLAAHAAEVGDLFRLIEAKFYGESIRIDRRSFSSGVGSSPASAIFA